MLTNGPCQVPSASGHTAWLEMRQWSHGLALRAYTPAHSQVTSALLVKQWHCLR